MERRCIITEFRVSPDKDAPKIGGYASVFDTRTEIMPGWNEEVDPHAFDKVLASNPDTRCLWNHDSNFPLGRTSAGTLHLNIDARGLQYECDMPETSYAKDLLVSMQRRDVTGSSFGFHVARDQWTDEEDGSSTRRILEVDMLADCSPVTYPAYTAADASVRSIFPDSMPVEMRKRFEAPIDAEKKPEGRALTDQCTCTCAQCMEGACGICSADPMCDGAERASWRTRTELKIRLAEAE